MKYLFFNGKILTQNSNNKIAECLLVVDNKIVFVGSKKELGDLDFGAKKIDLKGKLLLPGFIDTHIHFHPYIKLSNYINLSFVKNIRELKTLLNKINLKEKKYLKGYGLKISLFNKKKLNRLFLDRISNEIPIIFVSSDYHTYITNSKSIKLSKIDFKYIEKFKKKIGFLEKNNISLDNLDGYFYEDSYKIILDNFPESNSYINLDKIINNFHKLGIVSIEEMAFNRDDFIFYDKVSLKNKIRVIRNFPQELLDNDLYKLDNNWLKTGGLKLFYDGSLGSKTALLSKKYQNNLDYKGLRVNSKEEYLNYINIYIKNIKKYKKRGSIITHAIGDKAISEVVEIYSMLRKKYNGILRIEHYQHVDDIILDKTVKNNIFVSMQPTHLGADIDTIEEIGWIRDMSYRFNSIKNRDITIGFSSDAPVETINPFLSIYSAITHSSYINKKILNKDESISVENAIKSYTIDAAKLSNSEKIRGSLEVGKLADLIIIDDYKKYDNNFWLDAKSYLTMIDGKIVYLGEL